MELADFLAILDIVATVLIGFVITHMVSVRDSRTRAIKDYYILELADIKKEINEFYSCLFKGELEAKEIIGWYSAIRNRVENFDLSVRKTFNIYEGRIAPKLFYNYKDITNSGDFNANYNNGKIKFKATTKVVIGRNQMQLYTLIERTLYDVNNVKARDYIERKWLEFKSHYLYYRLTEKKTKARTCASITLDWLNSHKSSLIAILLIVSLIILLFVNLGKFIKENEVNIEHKELLQRIDSLNNSLIEIKGQMRIEPATIEFPTTYSIRLNEFSAEDTIQVRGMMKVVRKE